MKIGLFPMAAKPFHKGHFEAVVLASKRCDELVVYVSTQDRTRKGEVSISGADMLTIWRDQLENVMPGNVTVMYVVSPIRAVYEHLGEANEDPTNDDFFIIFSGEDDLTQNFTEKSLTKYAGRLYSTGHLKLFATPRTMSGTKMRSFLADNDVNSFIKNLPPGVDGRAIWDLLSSHL